MVRLATVVRTFILCGLMLTTLSFAKSNNKTVVTYPSGFAISQRASDLPIDVPLFAGAEIHEPGAGPLRSKATTVPQEGQEDPVLQKQVLPQVAASPGISFEGIISPGYVPSDSNLAVGPNDIVEVVNVQYAIYNKSGATIAGPTNIQSLFAPLGGNCAETFGDPVVLYDRPADRWVISFIGSPDGSNAAECVAVSQTGDPTGAYNLYGYAFGANLNDYPKLSTWATNSNSAYLATYNIFQNFSNFIGADICAFDRTKMQAGDPTAAQLCQMTPSDEFGYLPSDMDGPTPPVDGTPGLFITWQNNNPGQLYLRKLTLDFATATATLSSPTTISVANDTFACGNGGQCVPQKGTTQTLDTLGDRMMYRFAIRHFADHDRAVVNHAVAANSIRVGIRWYELYDPAGAVTLNQQGTFGSDANYRWMASLAEDKNGDIGLGYSISSGSIYPGINFTGRVPSDPAGTMESEASVVTGTGSQVGSYAYRWGDYTAMQVDPSDDCTFWYVDQYQKVTGTFDWYTNISSFIFNGCSTGPTFSLSASPSTVTITQGTSGTSTITVTPEGGFTGSVTLAASGLPSGVTAAFNPNPTTATSTLTLSASATAATGTATVTITGTSGTLTNTTNLSLTVNATGGGPAVTLSPSSLKWGKIPVGTTSNSKAVTVTNSGTGTLSISSIAASGDFGVKAFKATKTVTPCGSTLAAGSSCVIKVTFTPTVTGTRTGDLTITDNAPNSPQQVPLTGKGE
ncbi:MAG: choice-of-anchor D domain-containing protein [Terriglobales bacterium]